MNRYPLRTLKSVLIFTILLMGCVQNLIGCAQHAHQVRDAQDVFSQGAELDLARKFNMDVPGVSNPVLESHRYYALAVGTVNEAIRGGAADLRQDGLYGTALTIKALSLWRLGDTVSSKVAANEVIALAGRNSDTDKVWPRDLGICKSLPVLFKIDALADQAKNFAAQSPNDRREETIEEIMANADQIQTDLDQIVSDPLLRGHSFQFFLAEARCETANVLQEAAAATAVFPGNAAQKYYVKYNDYKNKALDDLQNVAKTHDLGDGYQKRVKKMKDYYSRILQTLP
jgi:hypothetical protein